VRRFQRVVMPVLWELPPLGSPAVPEANLRVTIRHAIMQVNCYVRIRTFLEDDMESLTILGGERRWVSLVEATAMALTELARKVLACTHLRIAAPAVSIASHVAADVL